MFTCVVKLGRKAIIYGGTTEEDVKWDDNMGNAKQRSLHGE